MKLRNHKAISVAYDEFWDVVWWYRQQGRLHQIEAGEKPLTVEQCPLLERYKRAARRVERKYGLTNLSSDDFEWGLLSGRMSALAWVLGIEWDESLDT